ncbi:MAG: cadmium-translocating P-type ATPase [Bacilli bacterium]|nr:cadmium-translocating P-type ATPase [Bacilli bacterium]
MIKKSYNISGFDCANCARKAEEHLNKKKEIASARIDFSKNKLYISYKENELSIETLLSYISEVETDLINLTDSDTKIAKTKIITKDLIFLIGRVLLGIFVIILAFTAFHDDKFFWVNFGIYLAALIILTYDILYKVIKHIIHLENPIDEYLLITISAYGAFAIAAITKDAHDFMEAIMVVALFQIGRVIEAIATNKSKEAIMSAVDMRIDVANVYRDNKVIKVKPEDLHVNDMVLVVAGEQIPVDGEIVEGEANIDTSSLTGEYVPVFAKQNTLVFSGTLVKTGSIKIKVLKEYKDSTLRKIADLITNSGEKKSKADKFITKFAKIYTPCVLALSILFIIIGGAISTDWPLFALNGLKMLVVACPCAIVISVPMAYFSAVGLASKNGIVVKGTNYLEELLRMKKLICDKTGTLTHGSFAIQKVVTNNVSKNELLESLYACECLSTHPVGKAICHGQDLRKLSAKVNDFSEISGLGTQVKYKNHSLAAGNIKLFNMMKINVPEVEDFGTIVYCSIDNKYIGYVVLSDEIKQDAQPMVDLLHSEDVEIILLTGDKEENAKEICGELGIDRYKAELLPEQKTDSLLTEMSSNGKFAVGYIGDGINDAASIRRSDVGIAMGGIGSDVAVENADIVIMNDDPAKVWDAIKIAKMARNTALFNIIAALTIKFSIEIVVAVSTLTHAYDVPMFVAVLADTGLTVLLVLNSLFLLYRKVKRKKL